MSERRSDILSYIKSVPECWILSTDNSQQILVKTGIRVTLYEGYEIFDCDKCVILVGFSETCVKTASNCQHIKTWFNVFTK